MADYDIRKPAAGLLGKYLKAMNSKPAKLVGEGLSAYANPPMWGYEKAADIIPWVPHIDELPVVGPPYKKFKELPKKIAEKWLEQPPEGFRRGKQMGKKWRGRWPRKPASKKAKRPIKKMGPGFPIGAMPLVAFQKRNWLGGRLGPNQNARPSLRPTEAANRKRLAQQTAAKVARYPWMGMGRWGIAS